MQNLTTGTNRKKKFLIAKTWQIYLEVIVGCSDVTHSTADICLYAGEWVDVSPPPDLLPLLNLCRGLERRDKEDICRMLPLLHNLPQACKHNVSILCTSLALFSNGQKQQMHWWGGSILFRDIFTIPSYLIQFTLAEVISKGSKTWWSLPCILLTLQKCSGENIQIYLYGTS